jgi:EAL domain-containing protein (putative c-di-GMP-specific phosphodiesterase class I)
VMLDAAGTTSEALRAADLALYAAKGAGKDRAELYHPSMATARLGHARLAAGLRHALERGEFTLHYQPIVHLDTGAITGAEALLRWTSAELGAVPPAEFVPIAERTGLIVPIGAWVLREACRQAQEWHNRYPANPMTVTVNVSGRQLKEPSFVSTVTRALAATRLPPACLVIEITETVLLAGADAENVQARLGELRELGVSVALDDFGTGFSSLAALRRLPINVIKVDRSFIQGDAAREEDWTLTRAILQLSESLGCSTIAEGVATAGQAARLRKLGCQYVQGFYFARPLPPIELGRLLAAPPFSHQRVPA